MRTEQPSKCFVPLHKLRAVVLLLFSVACQTFSDISPYVCSYYFSSVWVAFWERAANSDDHMFSLYFDYLSILVISRFRFEDWILIASVPTSDFKLLTVPRRHF